MKKKIDIDHICSLASLKLTEEDKAGLVSQMNNIVEWVDKLGELKINLSTHQEYTPVSFPLPFREDKILPSFSSGKALANSPEKEGEFITVPLVIQEK